MGVKNRREKYILSMLENLGLSEDIVFYDIERENKNAMANAKKAWLAETNKSHICVMQDDIELCVGFKEIVEECSERFPNAIFSFYNSRLTFEDKKEETPYIQIIGSGMYGQCIMMPADLAKLCFYWSDKNFGKDYPHDDTAIGFFAEINKIPVMSTIPCIVQHLGHNDSELGYNNKNKVSKVYMKEPSLEAFKTNIFFKSKRIQNHEIPPKGGYLLGTLKKIEEII